MTRSKLLSEICPTDCIRDDICEANDCDTICYPLLNKWLDEYDKEIISKVVDKLLELASETDMSDMDWNFLVKQANLIKSQ